MGLFGSFSFLRTRWPCFYVPHRMQERWYNVISLLLEGPVLPGTVENVGQIWRSTVLCPCPSWFLVKGFEVLLKLRDHDKLLLSILFSCASMWVLFSATLKGSIQWQMPEFPPSSLLSFPLITVPGSSLYSTSINSFTACPQACYCIR